MSALRSSFLRSVAELGSSDARRVGAGICGLALGCAGTMTWPDLLGSLVRRVDQPAEAVGWALRQILAGEATSAQVAAFVTALRSKGETVTELTGMVEVMLEFATPITVPVPAVDVVGRRPDEHGERLDDGRHRCGGGRRDVVKHGNRAASSACGAADVLEALGIVLDLARRTSSR